MQLILLTALAMTAFAANSVLNRMAVGAGGMDPIGFAVLRLLSGAVMLSLLVLLRRGAPIWQAPTLAQVRGRLAGVAGLILYLLGFSLAYLALPAGTGALILFGVVQVTMFAGAVLARERVPPRRWIGAAVAFAGLTVLLAPAEGGLGTGPAALMAVAGLGWGIYSLAGRRQADALGATAANFVLAVPGLVAVWLGVWAVTGSGMQATPGGMVLAVVSGAVSSGLGYALWYRVLPRLGAARAAVAQLTVPVIAATAGVLLLGEAVTLRFIAAAALVLAGVALASLGPRQSRLHKR